MRTRIAALAMTTLVMMFTSGPAHLHGQQTPPAAAQDHDQHHPETKEPPAVTVPAPEHNMMMAMMAEMKATDAKLDALVAKMNAATGAAKTDAMAELLTALVEGRHAGCEAMMGHMMPMMNMPMMQMMGGPR